MAYVRTDSTTPVSLLYKAFFRFFDRPPSVETGADLSVDVPLTNERTLRAVARLSDDQLDDIGVCRKARHVRSDYLARYTDAAPVVAFDYYRRGG